MADDKTFGDWLRRRRRTQGLTQQQLADCASCSVVTIRKFEADERRPSRQLAELLAGCLEIEPAEKPQFIAFARDEEAAVPLPTPPPSPFTGPTPAPSLAPPVNLPAPLTSLVGRQQDVERVCDFLLRPGVRLLTLTGPGGTGKTRLAVEVARRLGEFHCSAFPDGLYFVNLAAVSDANLVIPTIAETVGLAESGRQPLLTALASFLSSRRLLLVLDNFEQIVEAADQLATLLGGAAGLSLLVTSRIVLRLYGEHEFPVSPLAVPDVNKEHPLADLLGYSAVALFAERARAAKADFEITAANAASVAEICCRLDGLPLALELAAAWSKLFPPAALLARLSKRLDVLTSQNRHMTERQRTIRSTIDWSYNLLDTAGKQLFSRLGVFAGEFSLEAAEAILDFRLPILDSIQNPKSKIQNGIVPIFDGLMALVDRSMIQQVETAGESLRFRLLLTLHDYALEQLEQSGEREVIAARHAAYYLALAEEAAPHLEGAEQTTWMKRLDAEHDNLRAALGWSLERKGTHGNLHRQPVQELMGTQEKGTHGNSWELGGTQGAGLAGVERIEMGLRLVAALEQFWIVRSYLSEGRRWLAAVLEQANGASPARQAAALEAAARLAFSQGENQPAADLGEKSLLIRRRNGEPAGLGRVLRILGAIYWSQNRYAEAETVLIEGLAIQRTLGNEQEISRILNGLGLVYQYQKRYDLARRHYQESLAYLRRSNDRWGLTRVLNNLGTVEQEHANYPAARRWLEECLQICRELGARQSIAMSLNNLGMVAWPQGELDTAEAHFQECLLTYRELGIELNTAHSLAGLGVVAFKRGRCDIARDYLDQSIAVRQKSGDQHGILRSLESVAPVMLAQGHVEPAVQLLSAVAALRDSMGVFMRSLAFQQEFDQAVAAGRERLGPAAFEIAWEKGSHLSLQDALALADASRGTLTDKADTWIDSLRPATSQRFVQESLLAVGGMGEVYRGRDTANGRPVVIKRLRPELVTQYPELIARFVREGELLRQLNHPNIVQMIAAVQQNGHHLLVMEYVPGGSLRDLLNRQPQLPIRQAVAIGLELADALGRAHHLKILHRDLKPENVLLAADGTTRLTDFGIGYQARPEAETRLTQPGVVIGTTAYLSPEGFEGAELDGRNDIWALGVMLYEMVAGRHPFSGNNMAQTMLVILSQPIPHITDYRPDIPPMLNRLLARMLVKDREQRIGSARLVAAELEQIRAGLREEGNS